MEPLYSPDMSLFRNVLIMGMVEGFTEFLPVSSTGHLIVVGHLIHFPPDFAPSFEIGIQAGAILAVLVLEWRVVASLLSLSSIRSLSFMPYLLACLPAALVGLMVHDRVKQYLFSPTTVAMALIVGGIVMAWLHARPSQPNPPSPLAPPPLSRITWPQSLMVGVVQCAALIPGMSRSASAIVGGVLAGLSYETSARFSFLVAVPLIVAASAYELSKATLTTEAWQWMGMGILVSFLTGLLAIRIMLGVLRRYRLGPFAWYRIGLGGAILLWVYWPL